MSNNDKFIRDTEFGKLMENKDNILLSCPKCKYGGINDCEIITDKICYADDKYYFAKEETDGNT